VATVYAQRRRTYGELVDRVARLAAALQQLGMSKGDRVGVLSLNSDRYFESYFAIWWGGGVINPINIRWHPKEIAYTLDDCDTKILIVDETFAPLIAELAERSRALRTIVYAGDGQAPSSMFHFEELITEHAPRADAVRANDELAGIFYTGGTTGFPKGVMLSHAGLVGSTIGVVEALTQAGDIGLHTAPMFHLADGMFLLALTLRGCTQVIIPGFKAELVLETIQCEKVTNVLLVPTMIQMLVDHPRLPQLKVDSLRQIAYGASPISEALLDRTMERLPGVRFLQAYGLTEMSPLVSLLEPEYHGAIGRESGKHRSAGRPGICVEVKIVDSNGQEVAPGTVGEIVARGPGVMQGYWNNPSQTAAVLKEGWMHTGDAAYMDEEGFLFIVDRVKDMIISGGENIYSAEVENAIANHPAVAACAVIGIPDARWGEAVHAVIVCKTGVQPPDAEDIKTHCLRLIAGYKCPRSIEVRDSLPLSGAGKVLKTELREPYWKNEQRPVG
jgi:long-chain acyl-CoA synthetase